MPGKPTDIHVTGVQVYLLPIETRVPLKFGTETLTSVTCARVKLTVEGRAGRRAEGWGETPLSVQWAWPSRLPYSERFAAMVEFCRLLADAWMSFKSCRHPLELGCEFIEAKLPELLTQFNQARLEHAGQNAPQAATAVTAMPQLAALICASAFDIALHDAFGVLHDVDTYQTYNARWMSRDLSALIEPAKGSAVDFAGKYPEEYFASRPACSMVAWHLVGGLDPIDQSELKGDEPNDGYPVLLADWIERDGLKCLKIKLRGNDAAWDYQRIARVGALAIECDVQWLTTDFNCTVTEPAYVNDILDRLRDEQPCIYGMLLYVEQPFPYELSEHPIDVHSVSSRKPLFLDESAHDWQQVRLGRSLGWSGVALKTCKTQTGAILSMCWARAHGMTLMVQDLTNPMLAQIPHVRLAAHAGTIMGVETNAMQFYPDASRPEERVHPGIYRRRNGRVDLSSLGGPGLGYRIEQIERALPEPTVDL